MTIDVSVLVDGELDEHAAAGTLESMRHKGELRRAWSEYHLIGDTLRSEGCGLNADFTATLMSRLEQEPTVLAPMSRPRTSFLQTLVPIAASLMGVGVVVWASMNIRNGQDLPVIAAVKSPSPAAQQASLGIQRGGAQKPAVPVQGVADYLIAHQGFSVASMEVGIRQISADASGAGLGR